MTVLIAVTCLFRAVQASVVIEGRVAFDGPTDGRGDGDSPLPSKNVYHTPAPPRVAVVYLEGTFPRNTQELSAVLIQKRMAFDPGILPIQRGTKVQFLNCDDVAHEIFSYSAAKRFELGSHKPRDSAISSEVFDMPGLVTVRCARHEEMRGFILVLDTPYFATTTSSGNYRLQGLPPGRFLLKAWLNPKTSYTRLVELSDSTILHMDFP